ncbi:hypothetical protein ACRBEV_22135 [Methylobacterium phyllosphaerae]
MDDNGPTHTRTTLTNGRMRRLMWAMPVHTEHQRHRSIPFHRLPDTPTGMRARPGVLQRGDTLWHVGFVRTLRP